jgi:hypothetical protein
VERAPAVFPAGLDRDRRRVRKICANALLAGRVDVGGELELVPAVGLLEPGRREREEARTSNLRLVDRHRDRHAAEARRRDG